MLSHDEKQRLQKVFARHPDIRAVFLFGSTASGRQNFQSDIDLGVFASVHEPGRLKLDLLASLANEGFDKVDVVLLDRADPVTRYEAVRPNRLLYSRPDFDRGSTVSRIIRVYLDMQPLYRRQRKYMKKRLLDDKT